MVERLARLTSFSASREAALALRPVTDRDTVVVRQRETAEAVLLADRGVVVPMGGAHDVRTTAHAASLGHVLAANELLDIASTAGAAARVGRTLVRGGDETPLLATLGGRMPELGAIRELIESAIDDRGEVVDDASPELRSIRRELATAHERVQQRMQALSHSQALREALQEPIVTMRDGRYVLPVRAEFRSAVRGVVHDTSASGATLYIEPMDVVELGNRWRELQLQERHEVERILRELSNAAGQVAPEIAEAVELIAHIDVAVARARFAIQLGATDLAVVGADQSWIVEAPAELRLERARHPLLEGHVVPTSLAIGGDQHALLITGPNTGGKTVALKTAGLLCLMALAGLPVPAGAGTQIPVYDAVFADIGDEQSIEQSLSTFSGHMTAIIDIIERAGPRSLVLLDELGAGTDPTEGAALAIAIVDRLISDGATLIATTHHSELKLYAHRTEGVLNASVEFDVETLSPTYRLTVGLPGQSNALAIAGNLGMPADVIAGARAGLSSEQLDLESLLGDLRTQLNAAEQRAQRAATAATEAETLRGDLEHRLDALAAESAHLREEARTRIRRELREAERLLERTRREVEAARLNQARADLDRARVAVEAIAPTPPAVRAPRRAPDEPIVPVAPAVTVWLRGISLPGEALSEPDERGEFDVQLGSLRTRVRLEQVERTAEPGAAREGRAPRELRVGGTATYAPPVGAGEEIEIRGQRIDEALPKVEEYLDLAARSGRARVRLIHGKGTGTLRKAVRELLERHPLVTAFESGQRTEGGDGVTIAYLASIH